MANNGKLKAEVWVDQETGTIQLDLTPDQAVLVLRYVLEGSTVYVNLKTPKTNGQVRENPAAYAVE